MNKSLYEYLLEENVKLLKAIFETNVVEQKKELYKQLRDNLEYIKLLEVKIQNESGVMYGSSKQRG